MSDHRERPTLPSDVLTGHGSGGTATRRRFLQVLGTAGAAAPFVARDARAASFSPAAHLSPVRQTPAANPFGEPATQGGTYILAGVGTGNPRVFVPTSYYSTVAFFVCKLLYTPLVTLDPNWGNLGPAIAESWEWTENDTVLTMRLRTDIQFHDGQPLTARDVEFTYKLMVRADPFPAVRDVTIFQGGEEYNAGTSEELPGVAVVDDATIRFSLTAPSNVFLLNLSNCGILPAHAFGPEALATGTVIDQLPFFAFEAGPPIGTGPWRAVDYNPETNLTLERHEGYYKGAPILDGITLRFGVVGAAGIAGIQAGEFDGYFVGTSYQDARSLEGNEQLELLTNHALANESVLITATEKPYLPVPVRQGLLTAIDIPSLIETVTFGYAQPAPSIMMHASLFPNPDLPTYSYDPERARQLLAEGGWDGSQTLRLGQFTAEGTPSNIIAALLDMWQEVGVSAEYAPLDPANQVEIASAADHVYDVLLTSFAWLAYDPSSSYLSFACERQPFYSNYCNPAYDEAMSQAIRTLDPAQATALYQQAQTILQTDLPYAPIWNEPEIWAINRRMHGGVLGRGPLNDILSELWWKE